MDDSIADRTLHAALDAGINLIDTSPFYGETRSESNLGRMLKGIPRDRFLLATKLGRYGAADFDFSAARVIPSIEASLQRLGLDVLDIVQCHDIEFGSLQQVVEETIPALRKAQQQGKVRFIGVTGLPLRIYRYVLDRTPLDLILSYCHYTLFDRSLADLLPYLESHGVGILSASPLAMGLLSEHGPQPWHPASDTIKEVCAQARDLCRARGTSISRLALQFAADQPSIHSTVLGMSRPSEVEASVAALDAPRDPDLLAQLEGLFASIRNQSWPSGRLENT